MLSHLRKMADADLIREMERIVYREFTETYEAGVTPAYEAESGFFLNKASMRELRDLIDELEYRFVLKPEGILRPVHLIPEPPKPVA